MSLGVWLRSGSGRTWAEGARGRVGEGELGVPGVSGGAFRRRRAAPGAAPSDIMASPGAVRARAGSLLRPRARRTIRPLSPSPALPLGRLALGLVIALIGLLAPRAAAAQDGLPLSFDPGLEEAPLFDRAPLHTDGRYIVIRLAENRLYLFDDQRMVWSAPVGTGTGFRLEGHGRTYKFATPRGVFRVQAKEKDPVWIRPDWDFIENHQPIPPLDSPLRREPGTLGTTAMYIGYELAMHGTDKPDLVLRPDPDTRRVSHGCIRLTNEDARKLFYMVDIGTPVLIF